ncbi:MAG TPA: S8 family peptidase [Gemmatimonadales bacterium]|nr:S8 family peptidase [Gemmatimonadales bacterium]
MSRLSRSHSRQLVLAIVTLITLPLAASAQGRLSTATRAEFEAALAANGGRVIVTLKPTGGNPGLRAEGTPAVSRSEVDRIEARLRAGAKIRTAKPLYLIGGLAGQATESQIDSLIRDPNVDLIEPDRVIWLQDEQPVGALREQPGLRATAQTVPWGVDRVQAQEAWAVVGQGAGVKVGIMDSGGDRDHPDLLWAGGYNAMTNSTASSAWDDDIAACNGHGTHVAGTVAARDNNEGVVGVAPGVSLYALKVFELINGSCGAWISSQVAGLNWAVTNGIRVVNVSIGGESAAGAYMVALTNAAAAGTYMVAAAGNTGGAMLYPAAYNESIAVANLDSGNNRSGSSSYGPLMDVGAPGSSIYSTMPGGGYGTKSGTSMAAPHVTGVVALLLAQNPSLTLAQIRAKLQSGSLDVGAAGWDEQTGWGLIQAYNMVSGGGPVPVPLTLAVSPGSRSASAQQGTAAPGSSGTVTLSGDNAASTAWSAAKKKSWTTLTSASGTGSGTVAWTRNTSGLTPGVYVDTITVTASGAAGSPGRIIDTLTITAIPVPLALAVTPDSRSASAQQGTAAPGSSGTVTLTGDNASTKAWTAAKKKSWTTLTSASGTGSGTVAWTRNTSGLVPGVYVDTITVTASGAAGSPGRIIDTLTITQPLSIAASSSRRSRTMVEGSQSRSYDSVYVTLSGTGAASAEWRATKSRWRNVLVNSNGLGSGWVHWYTQTGSFAAGVHVDTIVISLAANPATFVAVIDSLEVTPAPIPLAASLTPTSRRTTVQSGTVAAADSAVLTLTGDGAASASWAASHTAPWSTLTTGAGTGSGRIRWVRNIAGLATGLYVDTITVAIPGATGSPVRLLDSLTVSAAPAPLVLALAPASRRVVTGEGSSDVLRDSAEVRLSGTGASTAAWSVTRRRGSTSLVTANGVGSGMLRWQRTATGLAAGTYVDTLQVTVPNATGSPALVIDTLVVTAAPQPLVVALSPSSRWTSVTQGQNAASASAVLQLTGDGAASATWSASSAQAWTQLTTTSGIGSGTVTWNRNTATLLPGTHVDTITVLANGLVARLIDSTVVIEQVVTAPVTQVVLARRGLKRRDVRMSGSPSNGVMSDSVQVTSITGLGSTAWTATKGASWLTLTTTAGQAPGWLRWTRQVSALGVGVHVDSIVVTASADPGVRAVYVDTLEVVSVSTPTPSIAVRDLFRGGGQLTTDQRMAFDAGGNRNGRFDLGDFLAWIRRNNIRLNASEMAEVQEAMLTDPTGTAERVARARRK